MQHKPDLLKSNRMTEWAYYGVTSDADKLEALLLSVEYELKQRIKEHPSTAWGGKQNNANDALTNQIYNIETWDHFKTAFENDTLFNYALNRWYNYWSAKATEAIFKSMPSVTPVDSMYDSEKDFRIQGIPFDHKTSVFPKGYPESSKHAYYNPDDLAKWFYDNQSQQQRKHLKNRLFIVVYDKKENQHWEVKAELQIIKRSIERFISNLDDNLISLTFDNQPILTSIIWAIRP